MPFPSLNDLYFGGASVPTVGIVYHDHSIQLHDERNQLFICKDGVELFWLYPEHDWAVAMDCVEAMQAQAEA